MNLEKTGDNELEIQEIYGGLFTWHSLLGRHSGIIPRLIGAGCDVDEVADAAGADPELQREWNCFATWALAMAQSHGFECTAMCMELCAVDSAESKVHLHVYFGRVPRHWRTPLWGPITITREHFKYENFSPNIRKTKLRNASNPAKHVAGGLWYCLAPKIGSMFKFGKQQLFKDTIRMCHSRTSPTRCLARQSVLCFVVFVASSDDANDGALHAAKCTCRRTMPVVLLSSSRRVRVSHFA